MNWLTKHFPAKNGANEQKLVVYMLVVIGTCCSPSALAGPLDEPVTDVEHSALAVDKTEVVTDFDLSFITGKGADLEKLNANSKLAVILWDEGGSTKRRAANQNIGNSHHQVSNTSNLQTVTLTVIHK